MEGSSGLSREAVVFHSAGHENHMGGACLPRRRFRRVEMGISNSLLAPYFPGLGVWKPGLLGSLPCTDAQYDSRVSLLGSLDSVSPEEY